MTRPSSAALAAIADASQSVMWHETATWKPYLQPTDTPLPMHADVVILGGGYTGLWTALWLKEYDPTLSVVVIEAEHIGFGASSRNGGWVSALMPTSGQRLAHLAGGGAAGEHAAKDALAVLRTVVAEFGEVLDQFGIDADYKRAGTFLAARNPLHEQRAHDDVADAKRWGAADSDLMWTPTLTAMRFAQMDQLQGGTFNPHCASIQPAKLVTGVARAAAQRGVKIHEGVRALRHSDTGTVMTTAGEITAGVVVRALEAYTPSLEGQRRTIAPVYSLMLATERLEEETLQQIGLPAGITFADYRHLIIYGQRTADNRIAFGGRGAPYHFGSKVDASYEQNPQVHAALFDILRDMFPQLDSVKVTHTWGGALAMPRDWTPSVGYDPRRKLAWSGGYLGDGVTMSYVGGRALAELICGRASRLTSLPWIGHHSRTWEPEPLRWMGIQAGLSAMTWADAAERRTGRASHVANVVDWVLRRP